MQTKLHQWATGDPHRRFDDLFNLVVDPAFLVVAWARVRGNKGARSAGVDGRTAYYVERERGMEAFLEQVRTAVRSRTFAPMPVREQLIPKPGTRKRRRLGIPTVTDRVVQASLKLVLEPIFEADFRSCSYGFRPNRRAHDAVAEVRYFTSKPRCYEWVVEGDITACFDEISHPGLMDRVRGRIGDKRVLALVKAFLKAGILSKQDGLRSSDTGTPQGGILSPLLANIALSVLDEHFQDHWRSWSKWTRERRRADGSGVWKFVRYADDFVILVRGDRALAETLRDQAAAVLTPMGLHLSEAKTLITHIDEGLDFLGWRIQRHTRRNDGRRFVYTYPSKKALKAVMAKVKAICRHDLNVDLATVLYQLNRVLRGWTAYFRPGVSFATFDYLRSYVWARVVDRLRRKHRGKITWKNLRRKYMAGGWWPTTEEVTLFNPTSARTTRYRYRGERIPSPWPIAS
ncbi:group II intron reverse transcriptase/maturase [Flexivirga caeni]|uniref:Group II intron reverse transcriptase/maturase n=1 Tax=Flexivirga caeni TaxID=2294115 RepID=A0A3M9LW91_9MICO|nr:group II intron reverse transcriptase/maturase [Flexivirga caeni]RNI16608.1 group II intron reverse transcriptase/maturase [Flexivirga caeni]